MRLTTCIEKSDYKGFKENIKEYLYDLRNKKN